MHVRRARLLSTMILAPSLTLSVLVALMALEAPVPAGAQERPQRLTLGVRVGEYSDAGKPFAGFEVLAPIGHHWWFDPNAEVVFVDHGHLVTANFDFQIDLLMGRPLRTWAGFGPAVVFRDQGSCGPGRGAS